MTAIQKVEPKPIEVTGRGVIPRSVDELRSLAAIVCRTMGKFHGKPDDAAVAIMAGLELGFTPIQAAKCMYVVNGQPAPSGDATLAKVRSSGKLAEYDEGMSGAAGTDDYHAWVKTRRTDQEKPLLTQFSVKQAKRAGLWGKPGPWTQYPDRQLRYRALGFNLRDNFGDVLLGLVIAEEARDYPAAPIDDETPPPSEPDPLLAAGDTERGDGAPPPPSPIDDAGDMPPPSDDDAEISGDADPSVLDDEPRLPAAVERAIAAMAQFDHTRESLELVIGKGAYDWDADDLSKCRVMYKAAMGKRKAVKV